ncbi:MAG: sulfite exporter TauE/SafE family protein [Clostridia bacterium]|nr:sulfite exporter TauE/SafE family protein [Clostridia bacterium]
MDQLWQQLLFLCPMLLIAGIVDGISGGGGLIALPSYLIAGVPITSAYACNKMQSFSGTSASLFKYAKNKFIDIKSALPAALTATVGSYLSTQIMLSLEDKTKNIIIVTATCFVILLMFFSYKIKIDSYTVTQLTPSKVTVSLSLCIGFILGLYDGFFGPGGGTIAILLFALIMKYDLRVGGGNGKFIIVVSNLISMVTYLIHGDMIYSIAIPCSISNIIGSYIGASLATKKGTGFVKYVSRGVIIALLIYTVVKLFF